MKSMISSMRISRTPKLFAMVGLSAALALGLTACGGDDDDDGGGGDATEQESGNSGITIKDFAFDPQPVAAGSTFTVTNEDSAEHTVTSDDDAFEEGVVGPNESIEMTAPSEPGEYPFHCERHTSMTGTLTVT